MYLERYFNLNPAGVSGRYTAVDAWNRSVLCALVVAVLLILSILPVVVFGLFFILLPIFLSLLLADIVDFAAQVYRTPECTAAREAVERAAEERVKAVQRAEAEQQRARAEAEQRGLDEREEFCRKYPNVAREQQAELQRQHEVRMGREGYYKLLSHRCSCH